MTLGDTLKTYEHLGAVCKIGEIAEGESGRVTIYSIESEDRKQTLQDIAGSVSGEEAEVTEYAGEVRRLDGTGVGVAEQALAVASGVVVGASNIIAGAFRYAKPLLYVASVGLLAKVDRAIKKTAVLGGPNNTRDVFGGDFSGGKMHASKVFSVNTAHAGLRPRIPSGVKHDAHTESLIHKFVDEFTTTGHALYAGERLRLNKDRLCNPIAALSYVEIFARWLESMERDLETVFSNDRYLAASNKARLEHSAEDHAAAYGHAIGFGYATALKESYGAAFFINNYSAKVVDFYAKGHVNRLLDSDESAALASYFKMLDRSAKVIAKLVPLIAPDISEFLVHKYRGISCFPLSEKGDRIPRIGTIVGEQSFGIFSVNYDAIPTGFHFAPLARRAGLDWPEYAPEEVVNEEKK